MTCAAVVPVVGFAGVAEFKEESLPQSGVVAAQSSRVAADSAVGRADARSYYDLVERNLKIGAWQQGFVYEDLSRNFLEQRSGLVWSSPAEKIIELRDKYSKGSDQYTRYTQMLEKVSGWCQILGVLTDSELKITSENSPRLHSMAKELFKDWDTSDRIWWPDVATIDESEKTICGMMYNFFYNVLNIALKKTEAAEGNFNQQSERFSAEITAHIDAHTDGLAVEEMISHDEIGVDHYAYAFSDPQIKPTSIIYYVHGGMGLTIHDPAMFKFTPEFLRENVDSASYHMMDYTQAGVNNRTLTVIPFLKSLVQAGHLVVCLNYPGSLNHGKNWNDVVYAQDARLKHNLTRTEEGYTESGFQQDMTIPLAKIIQYQITDLNQKVKDQWSFPESVPTTYIGHSMGGAIGCRLIATYTDFVNQYFSSVILACPAMAHAAYGDEFDEDTVNLRWSQDLGSANASLRTPVLIITGGEKDKATPAERSGSLAYRALTDDGVRTNMITYHQITNAGHTPHNMFDTLPSIRKDLVTKFMIENPDVDVFAMHEAGIPENVKVHIRAIKENMQIAIDNYNEFLGLVLRAARGSVH